MNTELTQAPIEQPEGQILEEPTAHEDEAVEVCEATAELFADELTEWTDVQITVSDELDTVLATGTTPGTCEPA